MPLFLPVARGRVVVSISPVTVPTGMVSIPISIPVPVPVSVSLAIAISISIPIPISVAALLLLLLLLLVLVLVLGSMRHIHVRIIVIIPQQLKLLAARETLRRQMSCRATLLAYRLEQHATLLDRDRGLVYKPSVAPPLVLLTCLLDQIWIYRTIICVK